MQRHVVADVAEPRLERYVEFDGVHLGDPRREEACQHAEPGSYLEHDVAGLELREPADDSEDVPVDEEMLAQLLLRRDPHAGSSKHAAALRSMRAASSAASSPRACA